MSSLKRELERLFSLLFSLYLVIPFHFECFSSLPSFLCRTFLTATIPTTRQLIPSYLCAGSDLELYSSIANVCHLICLEFFVWLWLFVAFWAWYTIKKGLWVNLQNANVFSPINAFARIENAKHTVFHQFTVRTVQIAHSIFISLSLLKTISSDIFPLTCIMGMHSETLMVSSFLSHK